MRYIVKGKATPKASERDRNRFKVLIEPEVRDRTAEDGPPETKGDVLDSERVDCRRRRTYYSPKRQRISTRAAEACMGGNCSWCIVDWLAERAADAWAYWRGRASLHSVEHGSRAYKALKVRSTPGALAIPHDGGLAVLVPGGDLRGDALDRELVRLLRDVPVEHRGPRQRQTTPLMFTMPRDWTTEQVVKAYATAEILVRVNAHGAVQTTQPVTEEDFQTLREIVYPRQRAQRPGVPNRDVGARIQLTNPVPNRRVGGQGDDVPNRRVVGTNLEDFTSTSESSTRGSATRVKDSPSCSKCDEADRVGWPVNGDEHWRPLWEANPWWRESMRRAHFPHECGPGGIELIRENGLLYPAAYLHKVALEDGGPLFFRGDNEWFAYMVGEESA